jgi:glycerophosphoryl diester phosphodiesterase
MIFHDTPVLCGHRGAGAGIVDGHRENTLASFRAAVEAGIRWVEVDARATADGALVALHDPALPDGRFVAELTAGEADAAGLMRVADLLEDLPQEVGVDIEVKTSLEDAARPREGTTAALVAALAGERPGPPRQLLVTSFDAAALLIVKEVVPGVPVGLLTWRGFPLRKAIPAAVHLGAQAVAPSFTSFALAGTSPERRRLERAPEEAVRVAHDAGLEVIAWCPRPAEAEELAAAGVDCLVVDDVPAVAARAGLESARR